MSERENTSQPQPRHESLRAAFDDELQNGQPEYGEARLWLVAHGPHDLFAYWEFDAAEHPEARSADGATHFHLRPLREDGHAEPAVEIPTGASNAHLPVSRADTFYTADIGFFAPGGVWCFIARSGPTRTPPDGSAAPARPVPKRTLTPPPWTPEQEQELQRLLARDIQMGRADRSFE